MNIVKIVHKENTKICFFDYFWNNIEIKCNLKIMYVDLENTIRLYKIRLYKFRLYKLKDK